MFKNMNLQNTKWLQIFFFKNVEVLKYCLFI